MGLGFCSQALLSKGGSQLAKVKADQAWIGLIIFASIVLLWLSKSLKAGAGYPRAMLVLLICLAVISFIISIRSKKDIKPDATKKENADVNWKDIVVFGVSPFIYLILWDVLGFLIMTPFFFVSLISL